MDLVDLETRVKRIEFWLSLLLPKSYGAEHERLKLEEHSKGHRRHGKQSEYHIGKIIGVLTSLEEDNALLKLQVSTLFSRLNKLESLRR